MKKQLASLLCLASVFITGVLIFLYNKTIDFPTIIFALKTIIPAGIVSYVGGHYLGKILESSKGDTDLIKVDAQKLFIDDLLLTPDEVVNNLKESATPNIDLEKQSAETTQAASENSGNKPKGEA